MHENLELIHFKTGRTSGSFSHLKSMRASGTGPQPQSPSQKQIYLIIFLALFRTIVYNKPDIFIKGRTILKRTLSVLLILSFLCSFSAFSFAANDSAFRFRDGIQWGMSESEILALEGISDPDSPRVSTFDSEAPDGTAVRRLNINNGVFSTHIYLLYGEKLCFAGCSVDDEVDLDQIVSEFTAEYGEEASLSIFEKAKWFVLLTGYVDLSQAAVGQLMSAPEFTAVAETMHYWKLPDGTEVFLGVDSLSGKYPSPFICFWDQAFKSLMETAYAAAPSKPKPTPTPTPTPPDKVTLTYSGNREVSYSLSEMRSALGGKLVLLRNSCMDLEADCDMTPLYEAMDFAILKGAVQITVPLTREQYETAQSWTDTKIADVAPGSNPEFYHWQSNYFTMLFPTLDNFQIWDNRDGTCTIRLSLKCHDGRTQEETAEYIVKGREAAMEIVNSIPASCRTGKKTDFKQLEFLYDYITDHVNYYDDSLYAPSYHSDRHYAHLLYDALVLKETVCAGFAYSFAYLCQLAGIDAYYVVMMNFDDPDGDTHAIAIAKEGGSYKWFDPTWDEDKSRIPNGYDFFGIDDVKLFPRHHIYSDTYYPRTLYPECDYDMTRGRMGYWDFDAMTYHKFAF